MTLNFKLEKDLCAAFAETVPNEWTIYNETAGFDMVLVHETGAQLAIEAKLTLNPKVLIQVCDRYQDQHRPGPDFRAVLVGKVQNKDLISISQMLGITVIVMGEDRGSVTSYGVNRSTKRRIWSRPKLPDVEPLKEKLWGDRENWWDNAPIDRLILPEYVPDVIAGDKSPVILGSWKIKAIKVCVWVEKYGKITRAHFKAIRISPSLWMNGHWLSKGENRGEWVAGPSFPASSYKKMHPKVYDEITFDLEKWAKEAGLL